MNTLDANATTAVLLAAGFGKRMLPLTEHTPKPLLKVGKHSLLEYHLIKLKEQGFSNIVINVAHLGHSIISSLGDGTDYGVTIQYSDERNSGPLETAGGLKKALPLIKSEYFISINADIWTDYDFAELLKPTSRLGRLVMVENPEHNPHGDFSIDSAGVLKNINKEVQVISEPNTKTYSGIALYKKEMFAKLEDGRQALGPIFRNLIEREQLGGELYKGVWTDVGTPERLAELNAEIA